MPSIQRRIDLSEADAVASGRSRTQCRRIADRLAQRRRLDGHAWSDVAGTEPDACHGLVGRQVAELLGDDARQVAGQQPGIVGMLAEDHAGGHVAGVEIGTTLACEWAEAPEWLAPSGSPPSKGG